MITEILRLGILRTRSFACLGDSRRCVHETDHIHNLPDLLVDYTPAMLAFYWQTERPLYIKQLAAGECAAFEPSWAQLKPFAEQAACTSLNSDSPNHPASVGLQPNAITNIPA